MIDEKMETVYDFLGSGTSIGGSIGYIGGDINISTNDDLSYSFSFAKSYMPFDFHEYLLRRLF